MSMTTLLGFFLIVLFDFLPRIDAQSYRDGTDLVELSLRSGDADNQRTFRREYEFAVETGNASLYPDSSSWRFGYRNTEEWGRDYPECNGMYQSPIDLDSRSMNHLKIPPPLTWNGYHKTPRNMTITNTGHSVELNSFWDNKDDTPYISGGTLTGDYVLDQLHFHWGSRDGTGSEHTINNRSLPLEMHMVHYKKVYGSMIAALKYNDGLAAVGVLFKITKSQNNGILGMQGYAQAIKTAKSEVQIRPFPLSKFHVDLPGEYVTYSGSMTTPSCSEVVTWILPAIPSFLTQDQLNFFRSVELVDGDTHNYRPTQPLNGRTVYYISRANKNQNEGKRVQENRDHLSQGSHDSEMSDPLFRYM